jgi:DNA integrity scanning protein DisA with diadenylate cyclase activity
LTDGKFAWGLGVMKLDAYDISRIDIFYIRFLEHHIWEMCYGGHVLMRVEYGTPKLSRPLISEAQFLSTFHVLFSSVDVRVSKTYYDLALTACQQRHGTILIISEQASNEAHRLENQATLVEPFLLKEEILKTVTAIDGAVILDLHGMCHAIGVILDGIATENGKAGRGARYNSCIRYVDFAEERGIPCLALIVSEDGTVELIPDLPRRISRMDYSKHVKILDEVLNTDFIVKEKISFMEWLDRHRFYHNKEISEKINLFVKIYNSKRKEQGYMGIIYSEFMPNSKMTDRFFID